MSPINEKDIQQKFNSIDEDLRDHNNRLINLEKQFTLQDEKLTNVEKGMDRLEKTILTSNNSIMGLLGQLVVTKQTNESQEKISKFDNLTKIGVQIIITGGILIGGILSGKFLF